MSTTALIPSLIGALEPDRVHFVAREAVLVATGLLVLAAAAQVVIPLPFTPVPLTGQTFAVLLVGGAYGLWRGASTLVLYLLVGALGAPVFADAAHGTAALPSASGGYLLGMLGAAALVGVTADRGWDHRLLTSIVAMVLGSISIYLIGAAWLAVHLSLGAGEAFAVGVEPFLIGDAIKAAAAAALLPGAQGAVRRVGIRGSDREAGQP